MDVQYCSKNKEIEIEIYVYLYWCVGMCVGGMCVCAVVGVRGWLLSYCVNGSFFISWKGPDITTRIK